MQTVGEIIKANQIGPTKPFTENTRTYAHSERVFDYVWRGLQAARFITKDEVVDGTDYRYWRQMLRDLRDDQLLKGFRGTEDFTGYLTWSEFRQMCTHVDRVEPSHKPFALPAPKGEKMTPAERQEMMKKLRAELGV